METLYPSSPNDSRPICRSVITPLSNAPTTLLVPRPGVAIMCDWGQPHVRCLLLTRPIVGLPRFDPADRSSCVAYYKPTDHSKL